MHPTTALLITLAAAGCASGSSSISGSASSTSQEKTHVDLSGSATAAVETTRRSTVTSVSLAVPADEAWKLLLQVYSDLKLPVTTLDSKTRLVGVQYQRLQQINGKRARTFFDCGVEQVTGGRDLHVLVQTQLEPGRSGDMVARTQVDAYARSTTGSGGARCSSTGALETLIGDELQRAVQARRQ